MLQALFEEQRQALNRFLDTIDFVSVEKVLQVLRNCKGLVIFSGVGKSGHIAEKIAATFVSTGTRASYLSVANALHGDLGFVQPEDVWISFSKSGSSQELLSLLPHIKKRGTTTIAVVSQPDSELSQRADLSVVLPVEKELCPYNLAPTISTAAQLIFGDCLAIALMQGRRFTKDDFAANHPAGLIGRNLSLTVSDLMLKADALPICRPDDRLISVLHELSSKRCGCLLVVDEQKRLMGIFTDGDLRRALEKNGSNALNASIGELLTPSPRTISPDRLALDAMHKMEENLLSPVTVLPVVKEGKVVGLIRMHDILQAKIT